VWKLRTRLRMRDANGGVEEHVAGHRQQSFLPQAGHLSSGNVYAQRQSIPKHYVEDILKRGTPPRFSAVNGSMCSQAIVVRHNYA
jgi:hypothetical protein